MLEASARLTGLLCGTQPMNDIWSPRATLQKMLDVEAALARASAAHKVIPPSAVAATLARDAALGGNLAIPLVKQLTARVKAADAEASKYVHWGATSQDIIDTATVLQLRDTFDLLEHHLHSTSAALAVLARTHRATPMIGRTWLQQALPITLGLKFAQWLDALLRYRIRLNELRTRVLTLQFGGAAGTLASLRDAAPAVSQTLGKELNLSVPALPWHTRHAWQDGPGYLAADANRTRRSGGARRGGQGRLVDHAAQAQSGRLRGRADRRNTRAWPRCHRAERDGAGTRTRPRRLAGRMGRAARSRAPRRWRACQY
jgi:hypothetical protein